MHYDIWFSCNATNYSVQNINVSTYFPINTRYQYSGLIQGLCLANERRHYNVTPSLIGWAQALNGFPPTQIIFMLFVSHTQAWTFCRQCFEMHFLVRNVLRFESNFTEICFERPSVIDLAYELHLYLQTVCSGPIKFDIHFSKKNILTCESLRYLWPGDAIWICESWSSLVWVLIGHLGPLLLT